MSGMGRREFVALLGGAAAAWPLAASAQQRTMPVVGFLGNSSPDSLAYLVRAFRQGLSDNGYVEGRNVAIEYRWANGQNDRMPALAADLVRRQVDVIAATTTPGVVAVRAVTTTVPTVFVTATDPVSAGLVASLNRPGGNLTGVTFLGVEITSKRFALLHELVPTANTIAFLVNPTSPTQAEPLSKDAQAAARTLGLQLHILHASTDRDFDTIFPTLIERRVGGLVIASDVFFTTRSEQLAALTIRHGVPAVYQFREFVAAGGLLSYGGSITDAWRLMGVYTGRILKGEKPSDLPVQQATKVEFFINLKTAKVLGLEIPPTLLARADEVIE